MRKIENSEHLREEIARLQGQAEVQEQNLRKNLRELRNQFRPENILLNTLSSVTGIKIGKNEFLKNGIALFSKQKRISKEKSIVGLMKYLTRSNPSSINLALPDLLAQNELKRKINTHSNRIRFEYIFS